ncbi:cytochrome c-type biogenesis protein CcmH [Roseiarcaceae bacterium H3SJ34-1]|uniref:cytochrome c-type biogenesis protein n=1 Tax=Terripilifer ovatus TaxID=3032367 RepID=UPI003AB970B6|nr:cytochrome c-type biogenesis protein CcmH [Roseiarcaceae bacterium H3SJ34-1]
MRRALLAGVLLAMATASAVAVEPSELLADQKLEARARAISSELRCLVCQNQSIDDSSAPLAKDLRIIVRERLVAGDSDADVRNYLVARYGEFILLKPPLNVATILLWGTPPAILLVGALALVLRTRRRQADHGELSEEERRKLAAILDENPG